MILILRHRLDHTLDTLLALARLSVYSSFHSSTNTMAVGPRVSKEEFMHALGLNPYDPQHEQYYRAMRVRPPL